MLFDPLKEIIAIPVSSPVHPSLIEEFEVFFELKGVTIRYLLDLSESYGSTNNLFTAHSVKSRLNALLELFEQKEIAGPVIFSRGGLGSQELLPYIGSVLLKLKTRVVFCGFSDCTSLLAGFSTNSNILCIHGPTLLSFRKEVPEAVKEDNWLKLKSLLEGSVGYSLISASNLELLAGPSLSVRGELIGGNLSVLTSIIGTPYQPETKGAILLLEDVEERPHKIYRNLMHLEQSGFLSGLAAIILGEFTRCDHPKGVGPTTLKVFKHFFENSLIPVYRTTVFGHGEKIHSLPLRRPVILSPDNGLSLTAPLFEVS